MAKEHSNNGHVDSLSAGQMQRVPAILFNGLGSTANVQLRWLLHYLRLRFGERPPHLAIISIDATVEAPHDDVPLLAEDQFLNLTDDDDLFQRLREAGDKPEFRDRLHVEACNVAGGAGSGSLPQVANFYLEQSVSRIAAKLGVIVDPFLPSNRAETAQRANRQMVRHGTVVQPSGPIDFVSAVSLVGGTAGGLKEDIRQTRQVLNGKGIPANVMLVASLPAVGAVGVDALAMRQNTYGRLQELADANAHEPLFDFVFLLPEPTATALEKHNRNAGQFLASLATPLGQAFRAKCVDTRRVLVRHGPYGQPKFLSLVNIGVLKPAARDPVAFATGLLGSHALTGTARPLAEPSPLKTHGFTLALLDRRRFCTAAAKVPSRVGDDNSQAFLATERRRLTAELSESAQEQLDDLARAATALTKNVRAWLQKAFLTNGPEFARRLAEEVSSKLNAIKAHAQAQLGQARTRSTASSDGSVEQRLEAIAREVEAGAHQKFLHSAISRLDRVQSVADTMFDRFHLLAAAFASARQRYDDLRRDLQSKEPQQYAVLDEVALTTLVKKLAPQCVAQVRKQVLTAAADGEDLKGLKSAVDATIARFAGRLAGLNHLDNAIRVAGDRAALAIENFLVGSEPKCRQDPFWDPREESMRWAFVTASPSHPVVSALRKTGRQVRCVPPSDEEVVLITADFGVEIGSLAVTEEAAAAYYDCPPTFPPFARADYEPRTDLLSAPEHEWFEILALPLHLHLGSGVIGRSGVDGFYFADGDERIPLGTTWIDAWRALGGPQRPAGLPPLTQLASDARQALFRGRDDDEALVVLRDLDAKLSDTLQTHERKQPFLRWRSVLRKMVTAYAARIDEAQMDTRLWGAANTPPERVDHAATP